jgi:hypothetical protein
LVVVVPAVALGAAFLALDFGTGIGVAGVALLALLAIPVLVVLGLVSGFTNQFVVPIMIAADTGVIAGWSRFWGVLRGNGWQFLLFLVVRWVLALGIGIAVFVVTAVVGLAVLVGAGVVGLLVVGQLGGLEAAVAGTGGLVALALVALVAVGILIVLSLALGVPVRSFLTSYELSVLGRADPAFALLPETGDDGGDGTGGGDGPRDVGGGGSPAVTRRDDADSDGADRDGNEVAGGNEFVWPDEDDRDGEDAGDDRTGRTDDPRGGRPG